MTCPLCALILENSTKYREKHVKSKQKTSAINIFKKIAYFTIQCGSNIRQKSYVRKTFFTFPL